MKGEESSRSRVVGRLLLVYPDEMVADSWAIVYAMELLDVGEGGQRESWRTELDKLVVHVFWVCKLRGELEGRGRGRL